jgi:phosphinothricin acetyltransferase
LQIPLSAASAAGVSPLPVIIRPAEFADAAAISQIYNHYVLHSTATFEEQAESLDDRQNWLANRAEEHPVFVAECEGQIVGWASLSPFKTRSAYRFSAENSIYLHPEWRGQKLGTRLLETLITAARERGYHTLLAVIAAEQEASVALHAKLGFQPCGQFRQVGFKFGRLLDVVLMQILLKT